MKYSSIRMRELKERMLDESGVSIIEFAICLPIMLLLVSGMMDFGLRYIDQHMIVSAVRAGARAGVTATAFDSNLADPDERLPCKHDEVIDGECDYDNPQSIECVVEGTTVSFLEDSRYQLEDWIVKAEMNTNTTFNSPDYILDMSLLTVSVEATPERKTCLFCFINHLFGSRLKAETKFAWKRSGCI